MQNKRLLHFIILICCTILLQAAHAESTPPQQDLTDKSIPQFIFPLECTFGKNCWTVNYVDVNPTEFGSDFRCGTKTYDTHTGTDFAVRSMTEVKKGVNVLAAADGKVIRTRDNESDARKSPENLSAIQQQTRECGNGVFIDHGAGIFTMYCHLKEGSVTVNPNDEVKTGEIIAQVGRSGFAEFPHLHFTTYWEGGTVDPFTGYTNTDGCGKMKQSLWKNPDYIKYQPVIIYDGGFSDSPPDFEAIEDGQTIPKTMAANASAFVYWTGIYGAEKDDKIVLIIKSPDGATYLTQTITQEKNRARQYYYIGRKNSGILPRGIYNATTTITRKNKEIASDTRSITIE